LNKLIVVGNSLLAEKNLEIEELKSKISLFWSWQDGSTQNYLLSMIRLQKKMTLIQNEVKYRCFLTALKSQIQFGTALLHEIYNFEINQPIPFPNTFHLLKTILCADCLQFFEMYEHVEDFVLAPLSIRINSHRCRKRSRTKIEEITLPSRLRDKLMTCTSVLAHFMFWSCQLHNEIESPLKAFSLLIGLFFQYASFTFAKPDLKKNLYRTLMEFLTGEHGKFGDFSKNLALNQADENILLSWFTQSTILGLLLDTWRECENFIYETMCVDNQHKKYDRVKLQILYLFLTEQFILPISFLADILINQTWSLKQIQQLQAKFILPNDVIIHDKEVEHEWHRIMFQHLETLNYQSLTLYQTFQHMANFQIRCWFSVIPNFATKSFAVHLPKRIPFMKSQAHIPWNRFKKLHV
jgi:hypothetical protein